MTEDSRLKFPTFCRAFSDQIFEYAPHFIILRQWGFISPRAFCVELVVSGSELQSGLKIDPTRCVKISSPGNMPDDAYGKEVSWYVDHVLQR